MMGVVDNPKNGGLILSFTEAFCYYRGLRFGDGEDS